MDKRIGPFITMAAAVIVAGVLSVLAIGPVVYADRPPEEHKVDICHLPPGNPENAQDLSIDESAWQADGSGPGGHGPGLHGGDYLGKCEVAPTATPEPTAIPTEEPTDEPTAEPTPTEPGPTPTDPGPVPTDGPRPTDNPVVDDSLPSAGFVSQGEIMNGEPWQLSVPGNVWAAHNQSNWPAGQWWMLWEGKEFLFNGQWYTTVEYVVADPTEVDLIGRAVDYDLMLITCRGYSATTNSWGERLVIFANLSS